MWIYGPSGKPTLIPVEEGIGKMKAALSARQDKRLVIAGRTSALAVTGIDDTILRAKAYEAAGVDAIFLAGGVTVEGIEAVSSAIAIPLITGGGAGQLADLDWMAAHKVRVALPSPLPSHLKRTRSTGTRSRRPRPLSSTPDRSLAPS